MKRRIVAIVTLCLIAILSAVGLVACDNTIKQTGITLDKTTMTIVLGDEGELTATITPADATDKTVVWTSSNEDVATVEDGTVTSVAVGTSTITAKTADGKFSATCAVTVEAPKADYVVKYYLQNLADDGYTLDETLTDTFEDVIGDTVTATPKAIANFTYNESATENVTSGAVLEDGSLVLKLYYTRNTVEVTATAEGGSVAGAGTIKYGAEATLTATAYLGYDFAGWYKGEEKVADTAAYTFTVDGATELTAKFDVKAEMAGFTFASTADTCVILSVEDTSIYQVVIPAYVTSIADGAFEDCVRLVEVINNSESFVVAKGETTNGSVGKYAYGVANCDADYESKIQIMEEGGISVIAYYDEATGVIVIIEYTTEETFVIFGMATAVLEGALAKCENLEKVYFIETAEVKAEMDIQDGAFPEDVVWYYFSQELPTEVGNYWHMEVVGETAVPVEWTKEEIVKAILESSIKGIELANFDDEAYLNVVSQTKGTADGVAIEYLKTYNGKNGVLKISGTNASDAVFTIALPKAMTAMLTGTQTAGQDTIKEKDEEGNPTAVDKIFDLTTITAEIYVVNAGTSAFGFFQSLDGENDYGWGNKNFEPTLNAWKKYSNNFITADHIRLAVGTGDFEFYIAGIYQGAGKDVVLETLSATLGENELANFDSQDYLDLITNDPVYGGRPETAEIGTFHGKDNVLRITPYYDGVYRCPIYLPKNPTGNEITVQFYLEGGSGFRFGLLGIAEDNAGWMNPNHATDYANGKWVTVVYTGFSDFANAYYQMIRFNCADNTTPDAIYIAGIWDGNQAGAVMGGEIVKTLGANELANFDSELYLDLLDKHPVYNAGTGNCYKPEAEIVDSFEGKTGVLKLSGAANAGNIKISLPKTPTQTTITMQIYLVPNASDETTPARVGLFGQAAGGWMNPNHATDYERGEWVTVVYTGVDNTGANNHLYICYEGGVSELYIAGIWDGDVSESLA